MAPIVAEPNSVTAQNKVIAPVDTSKIIPVDTSKTNNEPSQTNHTLLSSNRQPVKLNMPSQSKLSESPELNHNGSGNVWQLFSGLFVVIASIVVLVWLIKRFGKFSYTGQQTVKVLGGISLGTREKVVLIEVGKEQLLIGVAPGRVNILHQLQEPIEVNDSSESFQSVFGQRFKDLFKREEKK